MRNDYAHKQFISLKALLYIKMKLLFSFILFFLLCVFTKTYLNIGEQQRDIHKQDTLLYHKNYYKLEEVLTFYERVLEKGGWPIIKLATKNLKLNEHDSSFIQLRNRLLLENYILSPTSVSKDIFDTELQKLLSSFQKNNGIPVTGIPDSITILTLNIPLEKKIKQLQTNLKRWKKFPKYTENSYLIVNIPDFKLTLFRDDSVITEMKVIVGRYDRQTPIIHSIVTQIILNPPWSIPPTILKKDVIPSIVSDHSYLKRKHIRVFTTSNGKLKEVPTDSIAWNNMTTKNFSYRLVQDPGLDNALGSVKFMFKNKHSVYMHDTPSKDLFNQEQRTFSSGCIRVQYAIKLANYLLQNDTDWNEDRILKTIKDGKTKTISLKEKPNVYIEYFTAWIAPDNSVQFRKDVYKQD